MKCAEYRIPAFIECLPVVGILSVHDVVASLLLFQTAKNGKLHTINSTQNAFA